MARLTKKATTTLTVHLGAQQHERLVGLLLEQAENDDGLRDRLLLEAAQAGEGIDPSSYRRTFAEALRSGSAARRDGPRTSGAWAGDVHEVIGRIDDLLWAGHPAEVVGITEYALGRIHREGVDRSDVVEEHLEDRHRRGVATLSQIAFGGGSWRNAS